MDRPVHVPSARPAHRPRGAHARATRRALAALLGLALVQAAQATGGGCDAGAPAPGRARTFLGFACRDAGCAAHKAGFAWADREGIDDVAACGGTDEAAFEEGCRAFAGASVTAEQSGFQWAAENALGDDCDCSGAGARFAAGCEAFVRGFGR